MLRRGPFFDIAVGSLRRVPVPWFHALVFRMRCPFPFLGFGTLARLPLLGSASKAPSSSAIG